MTLTRRLVKGTRLTNAEGDANIDHFDLRTADGWADIVSEFYTRGGPASPGVSAFIGGIYLLEFSDTDTLEAFANFHIPHAYKPNTMMYPHIHFSTTSNNAGTVRWGVEYTFARRADSTGQTAFPATSTIYVDFAIPANSANKHFVAEAAQGQGIPGTDIEVDGMVMTRVFREPGHVNDTFVGSVWAITADLHIEVDRHSTPNRAPNFYA
jgi:hypothetical protein